MQISTFSNNGMPFPAINQIFISSGNLTVSVEITAIILHTKSQGYHTDG